MHLVKLGGSFGTITGELPPLCDALPLAATYIQWLNAWVVIGLPATSATESPGTPEPHAEIPAASAKKAPSAPRDRLNFTGRDGSDSCPKDRPRPPTLTEPSSSDHAASRVTASRTSAVRTSAGNRSSGASGTRTDNCERPD